MGTRPLGASSDCLVGGGGGGGARTCGGGDIAGGAGPGIGGGILLTLFSKVDGLWGLVGDFVAIGDDVTDVGDRGPDDFLAGRDVAIEGGGGGWRGDMGFASDVSVAVGS